MELWDFLADVRLHNETCNTAINQKGAVMSFSKKREHIVKYRHRTKTNVTPLNCPLLSGSNCGFTCDVVDKQVTLAGL